MREPRNQDPGSQCTIEVDAEGRIESVGRSAAALLGAEQQALRGATLERLLAAPRDEPMRAVSSASRRASPTWLSARFRTADGPLPCLIRVVPLEGDGAAGRLRLELTPRQPDMGR